MFQGYYSPAIISIFLRKLLHNMNVAAPKSIFIFVGFIHLGYSHGMAHLNPFSLQASDKSEHAVKRLAGAYENLIAGFAFQKQSISSILQCLNFEISTSD